MVQYRFRLTGVPPDQAIKLIEVDPNQSLAEIKKSVQKEYKLIAGDTDSMLIQKTSVNKNNKEDEEISAKVNELKRKFKTILESTGINENLIISILKDL